MIIKLFNIGKQSLLFFLKKGDGLLEYTYTNIIFPYLKTNHYTKIFSRIFVNKCFKFKKKINTKLKSLYCIIDNDM